jgi:hypothetical protein
VLRGCPARSEDPCYRATTALSAYQASSNPGYGYRFYPIGDWGSVPNNNVTDLALNPWYGRIRLSTLKQPDRRGAFCDAESLESGDSCGQNTIVRHERHRDASGFAFFSGRTAMLRGKAAQDNAWSAVTPMP